MKKVIVGVVLILLIIMLCGCGANKNAKDAVIQYLEMYRMKDKDILSELDEYVENENLTENQKEKYKEILEREYSTLMYEVVDEQYEGNSAIVSVDVTVIDLYKAQKEAAEYFNQNSTEFNDEEGEYDRNLYMDYKLDLMSKETDTITYTINIKVNKEDDKWKVSQLSNESLEKIHGIYNYEE